MKVRGSVVVITGASGGIGCATALLLARKGARLVLAARRQDALDEVARECEARGAVVVVLPTDVTDPAQVEDLARQAVGRFGRLDAWVNNAAVASYAPFLEIPLDDLRRVMDVNVMGYVHGARAALPVFGAQGEGTLVNVSSIVSGATMPYAHSYAMSKAAVRALSTSLRQELFLAHARGIHVCTVLPASIDTPFYRSAANATGGALRPIPPVYPAEQVARTIVSVLRRPRREVFAGRVGRTIMLGSALAPRVTERAMAIMVDRVQVSNRETPHTRGTLDSPGDDTGAVSGGYHGRARQAARRGALAAGLVTAIAVRGRRG